jgi:hypothetical protein
MRYTYLWYDYSWIGAKLLYDRLGPTAVLYLCDSVLILYDFFLMPK